MGNNVALDIDSYLAGVFDGEGCISAQHKEHYTYGTHRVGVPGRLYTRLYVNVAMTSQSVVRLFHERFGGGFHDGYLFQSGRTRYQWGVTGGTAIPALEVFSQLCVEKKRQAELALELAHLLRDGRARGKRPEGYKVVGEDEMRHRIELAETITRLKRADT